MVLQSSGVAHEAFMCYVIAYVPGYLLNLILLRLAVDPLHLPHRVVQDVAIVVVAVGLFILHKCWVFGRTPLQGAA